MAAGDPRQHHVPYILNNLLTCGSERFKTSSWADRPLTRWMLKPELNLTLAATSHTAGKLQRGRFRFPRRKPGSEHLGNASPAASEDFHDPAPTAGPTARHSRLRAPRSPGRRPGCQAPVRACPGLCSPSRPAPARGTADVAGPAPDHPHSRPRPRRPAPGPRRDSAERRRPGSLSSSSSACRAPPGGLLAPPPAALATDWAPSGAGRALVCGRLARPPPVSPPGPPRAGGSLPEEARARDPRARAALLLLCHRGQRRPASGDAGNGEAVASRAAGVGSGTANRAGAPAGRRARCLRCADRARDARFLDLGK